MEGSQRCGEEGSASGVGWVVQDQVYGGRLRIRCVEGSGASGV